MKVSRYLAIAISKINEVLDISKNLACFECVLPEDDAKATLYDFVECVFLNGHEIWVLSELMNHPYLETLRKEDINEWVDRNFAKGEHGLFIEPETCQILFISSFDEGDGQFEIYSSCKRGKELMDAAETVYKNID